MLKNREVSIMAAQPVPVSVGGLAFDVRFDAVRGLWLQAYLGAIPKDAQKLPSLDILTRSYVWAARDCGMAGVLFHAGPRHLERHHARYAALARREGVNFGFAYGLDGEDDTDGTRLTVEEKGSIMGAVAASVTDARLSVPNAEIAYDTDTGPEDDMDESGVLRMGAEVRKRAPNALFIDQPWFAMDSHGEERKTVKPLGQGGTFAGFPSDEFASWADARAPQVYFRNFGTSNPEAYRRVVAWIERDWAKHDASLARLNLQRPRTYTLQGYGHNERPQDFVHALLLLRDRPRILWTDHGYSERQWPVTIACMQAAKLIVEGGHAPAGVSPSDCIRSWQRALGFSGTDVDGWCGYGTLRKAGMWR